MNASPAQLFFHLTYLLVFIQRISCATDTIGVAHGIRDVDGDTIVSPAGIFQLGFFSPGNSTNRFVGIWFTNVTTEAVVWVANRASPIPNRSGVLKLTEPGVLVIIDDAKGTVWSSNASKPGRNPVAQLLDSGNLVVKDAGDENYLWQSFDHPTDTRLMGMKFGRNFVTGADTYITSWKSDENPAPGDFTYSIDVTGYPQIYLKKNGVIQNRLGPWNGLRFRWRTKPAKDSTFEMVMVMNQNEVSYVLETLDKSVTYKFSLSSSGVAQLLTWVDRTQEWRSYMSLPADECDKYGLCGAFGSCTVEGSPMCVCLNKFVPRDQENWISADWSGGCVRRTNLSCKGDGFLKYWGLKLPEARNTQHKEGLAIEDCRGECLRNCSCTAYSQLDIKTLSGCLFWYGELIDMRKVGPDGQDIYIRVAASELESGKKKSEILTGSLVAGIGMVLLLLGVFLFMRKRKNKLRKEGNYGGNNQEDSELPFFEYSVILKATDHFSDHNKLGEGGFGPVFKGDDINLTAGMHELC